MAAPCNICGYEWPTRAEQCAYRVNVEDLLAARKERDELRERLERAEAFVHAVTKEDAISLGLLKTWQRAGGVST